MKLLSVFFALSAAVLLTSFAIAYVQLEEVSGLLVLYTDTFRGINFLGNRQDVFAILGLGLVVVGVNYLLAAGLYSRDRFLPALFAISSIFISVLLFAAVSDILSHI